MFGMSKSSTSFIFVSFVPSCEPVTEGAAWDFEIFLSGPLPDLLIPDSCVPLCLASVKALLQHLHMYSSCFFGPGLFYIYAE